MKQHFQLIAWDIINKIFAGLLQRISHYKPAKHIRYLQAQKKPLLGGFTIL
jgi:hypothetical protein